MMTTEKMFAYITDCQLATVESMAMKKSTPVGEFKRQCSIAKTCVDWMLTNNIPYDEIRVKEIVTHGSFDNWIRHFSPSFSQPKNV